MSTKFTRDKENQLVLKNDTEGLDEGSILAKFASKMKDGYEVTLTPKEAKKLICYLNTLKTGFQAAVPIICMGEQCPYVKKCPLGENNNYPMGYDCPIEDTIKEIWYADYAESLEIEEGNKIDESLTRDLVLWEVLAKRAVEELAADPKIVKRSVAGFQDTSEGPKPIYREEMNQRLTFLERAQKQKMKIMDSLIATREAKSKDTNRMIHDPCYDEQTEVLTDSGWKFLSDVCDTDKICSLNKGTFEIIYDNPTMIYSNDYDGKMYSLIQSRAGINLLVTPNHKLFTGKLEYAKDLFGAKAIQFYKAGKWNGRNKSKITLPEIRCKDNNNGHKYPKKNVKIEDWLEFLGYYLSEGAIVFNKRKDSKSGSYVITFYQKDENDFKKIFDACKKVTDSKVAITGPDKKTIRFCDKRLYNFLKPLGNKYNKYIPRELFNLKTLKLKILFDALMLGDGRTNENGGSYYCTSSDRLKDDFQELLLKIGLSGTSYVKQRAGDRVWFERRREYITCTKDHWRIMIKFKNNSPIVKKRQEEWVDYSGKIYCVEVPSHIIYVRRNGCVCWCGNSSYAAKLLEKARELKDKAADMGLIDVTPEDTDANTTS